VITSASNQSDSQKQKRFVLPISELLSLSLVQAEMQASSIENVKTPPTLLQIPYKNIEQKTNTIPRQRKIF